VCVFIVQKCYGGRSHCEGGWACEPRKDRIGGLGGGLRDLGSQFSVIGYDCQR